MGLKLGGGLGIAIVGWLLDLGGFDRTTCSSVTVLYKYASFHVSVAADVLTSLLLFY